jgi:uncharacterized protein
LQSAKSIIIAYSGGVDSSLLAFYARKTLGKEAKIVIAISPSLAEEELEAARSQSRQFDWDLIEIRTDEVDNPDYQRNDTMRCYFCKSTLFDQLERIANDLKIENVAYGANLDDLADFRPGHKAARERNVLSPLQSAKLTKPEIRELARAAGLPSWDRPQAACLSSRFPTFELVTASALSRVDRAERFAHSLGFKQVRVRNHSLVSSGADAPGETNILLARLEVEQSELIRFAQNPELFGQIDEEFKRLGFKFVTLDLGGYRQGSANVFISKTVATSNQSATSPSGEQTEAKSG